MKIEWYVDNIDDVACVSVGGFTIVKIYYDSNRTASPLSKDDANELAEELCSRLSAKYDDIDHDDIIQGSKLHDILGQLSEDEIEDFAKFVAKCMG